MAVHQRENEIGKMGNVSSPFFFLINSIHSASLLRALYVPCTDLGARNRVENKSFFLYKVCFLVGKSRQ